MLVFAAVMPHPPILIPGVGKDNLNRLKKTNKALDILEQEFISAKPDTVIIISPHGDIYPDVFSINTMPEYQAQYGEFGDFETKETYKGDIGFINRFKEQIETTIPMNLKSDVNIDHGTAIPLAFLSRNYKDFKIVPITYSFLDYEKHIEFGEALKEAIYNNDKRVAVIASADLSHRLSPTAPAGFSPKAKDFDKKLIQILKKKQVDGLLNIDKELIEEAGECGLRSILILAGIVKNMSYDFQVLSYEAPFGVGYLVAEYKFS